jgi:potassium channel subfamily K
VAQPIAVVAKPIAVAGFMMGHEGRTFQEAFYWLCITGTTAGYGDITPQTSGGKVFAGFYILVIIPAVTGAATKLFGKLFDFCGGGTTETDTQKLLNGQLTEAMIEQFDADGSGTVSREEWIIAMLIRLNFVQVDTITKVTQRFDKLDVNHDGELMISELIPSKHRPSSRGGGRGAPRSRRLSSKISAIPERFTGETVA